MFRSGIGPGGKPRVELTVCPVRLIDPEMEAVVDWFFVASTWDGWSGMPAGPPEWPRPGGLGKQDAKLVAAYQLISAELRYLPKPKSQEERKDEDAKKRGTSCGE